MALPTEVLKRHDVLFGCCNHVPQRKFLCAEVSFSSRDKVNRAPKNVDTQEIPKKLQLISKYMNKVNSPSATKKTKKKVLSPAALRKEKKRRKESKHLIDGRRYCFCCFYRIHLFSWLLS